MTDVLNWCLKEIERYLEHLEISHNRVFEFLVYEHLSTFHRFNLCFKQFWDEFDRHSASQILQYRQIIKTYIKYKNKYLSLLKEERDFLESEADVRGIEPFYSPSEILNEYAHADVIGYYDECLKKYKGKGGLPLYDIYKETEKHLGYVEGKPEPLYILQSERITNAHLKGLAGIVKCLDNRYHLMCVVCRYPEDLINGYKPSSKEIIGAIENGLRQYAKDFGKNVERDLKIIAQGLKPSRNTPLTPDVWGRVMECEDEMFQQAVTTQVGEIEKKYLENISVTANQLIDNCSLLEKIKASCVDEELFDISLSVKTHNLMNSLNAENLDLFYELVLRRDIIQREMFPEKLKAEYDKWLNLPQEQHAVDKNGKEINFFAPKKSLQELLKQDWLAEIRADEKYDVNWTGAFIEALMASPFGNKIACDWDDKGRHGKCTQIKGYILGLLKDEGVLKGSYDSIAARVGLTDEPRTLSRYMGQGKKQPYAEWVKESVAGNFSSLTEKNAQTFGG